MTRGYGMDINIFLCPSCLLSKSFLNFGFSWPCFASIPYQFQSSHTFMYDLLLFHLLHDHLINLSKDKLITYCNNSARENHSDAYKILKSIVLERLIRSFQCQTY